MPHFFAPPGSVKGDRFVLKGDEARHLIVVLRKKPGDEVGLFDGQGNTYRGRIERVQPRLIEGSVIASVTNAPPTFRMRLLQSLPKGDKFDWVLQKSAELGVAEIVPIYTERSITRIPADRISGRRARWQKIVMSAIEQSGQTRLPVVSAPLELREALALYGKDALTLIPWEGEENTTLKQVLRGTVLDRLSRTTPMINVLIGPEGGFAPKEVELAQEMGAVAVSLGPTILRTETAGLFVASALLFEFGG